MSISQPALIGAIVAELERQGVEMPAARHFNAVIAAANAIIDELNQPFRPARPNSGLQAWLSSDDAGLSSKYMASVLNGSVILGGYRVGYAHPHDIADFSRCVKLLQAVPQFEPRLPEMRKCSPQWSRLVAAWPEIVAAMDAGDMQTANDMVREAVQGDA
jgi:hypothetical protein